MIEDIEKENQKEEEQLTCPECGKDFQDMRGLTSHARHKHELDNEETFNLIKNESDSGIWNLIGGVSAIVLAIITLGKYK
jgi:uncharacterized C2H2 Zn-finger protein